jgi:hypothetical protein
VQTVTASSKIKSVTENHNALTNQMKVTTSAASKSSGSTMINVAAAEKTNGNAPTLSAASRSSHIIIARSVDVTHTLNCLVQTVTASSKIKSVTENHNALTNQMKVTTSAASKSSGSTMINVAAAEKTNGNAPTLSTVSKTVNTVMVKSNVPMDLMRVILTAASKTSDSTTTKNAAAKNPNGNVPTVSASLRQTVVMVKPNVLMSLMKVTKTVASRTTNTTTLEDVVVIQKPSGSAQTVSASITLCTVTEHLNVPINPMKEWVNLT